MNILVESTQYGEEEIERTVIKSTIHALSATIGDKNSSHVRSHLFFLILYGLIPNDDFLAYVYPYVLWVRYVLDNL